MSKFLVKAALFVLIIILLNETMYSFCDYSWGRHSFGIKVKYYNDNKDKFNTVFVGSSRMREHINPILFNNLLSKTHYDIVSISLAGGGIFNPEAYYLYEKLLHNSGNALRYAFLELQPLYNVTERNLHTIETKYWLNFSYYKYVISYILYSDESILSKFELMRNYTVSYVEKVFAIGIYSSVFNDLNKSALYALPKYSTADYYRFVEHEIERLKKGRKPYKSLNADVDMIRKVSLDGFADKKRLKAFNYGHYEKLMELIRQSKKKGIHLIFLIHPRLERYDDLLAAADKLPKENVIELADARKYPQFYLLQNTSDKIHLNSEGAEIFTRLLAEKFMDIIHIIKNN
ncbi:hypothetical protein MCHI_000335 [Candidatus Magnetoovum chiemensis]|nr:hypothetical protein MCHI_000335 [Candidatus Magnetoovum chiemensis]